MLVNYNSIEKIGVPDHLGWEWPWHTVQHLLSCIKLKSESEILTHTPDYFDLFGGNIKTTVLHLKNSEENLW